MERAHASPRDEAARDRLAYDEIFASQVALMLIRQGLRTRKGRGIRGDGRLTDALKLPFGLTRSPGRVGRGIAGDMAQGVRSEERRGGKGCVRTCRSRVGPDH